MITSKWSVWKQVTAAALAVNPSYFIVNLTPCPIASACFITGQLLGAAASQSTWVRAPAPTQAATLQSLPHPAAPTRWRTCCRSLWVRDPALEVHKLHPSISFDCKYKQQTSEHSPSLELGQWRTPCISMITWQLLYIPWNTLLSSLLQNKSGALPLWLRGWA